MSRFGNGLLPPFHADRPRSSGAPSRRSLRSEVKEVQGERTKRASSFPRAGRNKLLFSRT